VPAESVPPIECLIKFDIGTDEETLRTTPSILCRTRFGIAWFERLVLQTRGRMDSCLFAGESRALDFG
jgi:hypothetical protein